MRTFRLLCTRTKKSASRLALIIACGYGMLHPLTPCRAAASPQPVREDHLRAGYLFNFAKFVEWPNSGATDVLTICFVGGIGIRDSFAAGGDGKQVGTRAVVTRTLSRRESTEGCAVLYVEAAAPFSQEYMNSIGVPGLLTVGDAPDFIRKGGTIELFADNNRLRFNVNLDNARRAGLRISSSLLQLASRVEVTGK